MTGDPESFMAPASRAHKHLQELMGLLAQMVSEDRNSELKVTLFEHGTAACALARLGTQDEMIPDLTAMQEAAAKIAAGSETADPRTANVQRLIDATLAELRGH